MKSISNLSTALIIAAAIVLIGNILNIGLSTVAAANVGITGGTYSPAPQVIVLYCFSGILFALGEGLGLFDLVVIDLLWWRNIKRIRFSFLPEKSYYQDPSKHIGSFLRGIPLFAVVVVLSAAIVISVG